MTLKLKKTDTFKTRIDVVFPDGSVGDYTAEFAYLNREQLDELLAERLSDGDFVARVLKGTTGIADDAGQPMDFPAALAAIQGDVALSAATVRGFFGAIAGAPAKNSATSRAR